MIDPQAGGSLQGRFFDAQQRATIEAAMARIIPTDDQPGAREAGTVEFLDRYLSGLDYIYAKPDGSGFEKLEGKRAEAWQRRIAIMGAKYVEGIKELDRRSQSQFGADFVRLTAEQQDSILAGLERPTLQFEAGLEEVQAVAGFAPVEPALQQTSTEIELDFFPLLALHTRQGFYADSIYGGNKNRVGWKLIGFEGPESLAETHAGRFTTLPFFAEQPIDWGEEQKHYGAKE
jgi:gluconate 2-dehydrogenase gamma chain